MEYPTNYQTIYNEHNEEDGSMFILPECSAGIKEKTSKRCQEKHPGT